MAPLPRHAANRKPWLGLGGLAAGVLATLALAALAAFGFASATDDGPPQAAPVTDEPTGGDDRPVITYEPVVVETYPHDPGAFTQGLEFAGDTLVESTGLVGESSLRLVEPETGAVLALRAIPDPFFAEGATVVGDEIFQLTWQDETLIVHSLDGLQERRRVPYSGEGWGLCALGDRLVMSDGSDRLTFRDPVSFEPLTAISVTLRGEAVERLNELECVGDTVWANVWQDTRIVAIDSATGVVEAVVDVAPLVPPGADGESVANGIAYDERTGRFWLTGKRWPVIYEVELAERT